jgi:hypothetical protein
MRQRELLSDCDHPGLGILGAIAAIIADQERIIANQNMIIASQEELVASREMSSERADPAAREGN